MNIEKEILNMIVYQTAVNKELILSTDKWENIGIDSLDALEIMLAVSEKFNITIEEEDEDKLENYHELIKYVTTKMNKFNDKGL